jgi:hypothetical protein
MVPMSVSPHHLGELDGCSQVDAVVPHLPITYYSTERTHNTAPEQSLSGGAPSNLSPQMLC